MENTKENLKQRTNAIWLEIKRIRAEILDLYDQGEPLTSERFRVLSKWIDEDGLLLEALDRQLEESILQEV